MLAPPLEEELDDELDDELEAPPLDDELDELDDELEDEDVLPLLDPELEVTPPLEEDVDDEVMGASSSETGAVAQASASSAGGAVQRRILRNNIGDRLPVLQLAARKSNHNLRRIRTFPLPCRYASERLAPFTNRAIMRS